MPEWNVDWEIEVEITLTKTTYTVGRSEVIEADTAEEAVQKVKDDMYFDSSDIDISQFSLDDFEFGDPDESTFKLESPVTEF